MQLQTVRSWESQRKNIINSNNKTLEISNNNYIDKEIKSQFEKY